MNYINHGVWIDTYNYEALIKAQSEGQVQKIVSSRSSSYKKQINKAKEYKRRILK